MRPVSRVAMALALTVSAGSMLAHNLYELPLSPIDAENSGPILFAAILGVALRLPTRLEGGRGRGAGLGGPEPRDRRDRQRAAAVHPAVRARAVGRRTTERTSCTRSGRSPSLLVFRAYGAAASG